ncbi:uncharacterized protein V1516DRAFT_711491 [Lipomyces oligophaga]|uniref:uncharacterized protein n=1 Tax=Lipomyces oligophaga TaxID=45792 RepID=UPI0034CFF183
MLRSRVVRSPSKGIKQLLSNIDSARVRRIHVEPQIAAEPPYFPVSARSGPSTDHFSSLFPLLLCNNQDKLEPSLSERLEDLQRNLVAGREYQIADGWHRLLKSLELELAEIRDRGSAVIPIADFNLDIEQDTISGGNLFSSQDLASQIRKRGIVVIKNVIPPDEAGRLLEDTERICGEPGPIHDIFWSKPQLQARSHPNMLRVQSALMSLWRSSKPNIMISTNHPVTYADRIWHDKTAVCNSLNSGSFIPGIDGGSIERWEDGSYASAYGDILDGAWESYDAMDYAHRVGACSNIYDTPAAPSVFRMYQGLLSLSTSKFGQGPLRVLPLLKQSTAYTMLRPFFDSLRALNFIAPTDHFPLTAQGASQEFSEVTHPHLNLNTSMVSMPDIEPGDYVAWHCDLIQGMNNTSYASTALYIPVVPLTIPNAQYLVRQRSAFDMRTAPPDFTSSVDSTDGIPDHFGQQTDIASEPGMRASGLGYAKWDIESASTSVEHNLLCLANKIVFGARLI